MEENEVLESEELEDPSQSADADSSPEGRAEEEDSESFYEDEESEDDEEEIEDGADGSQSADANEEEDPFESLYEDEDPEEDEEGGEDPSQSADADSSPEGRDEGEDHKTKYDELSGKVKATLEKLGYKGDGDPMEMLDRLEAEADGVSAAEYDRQKAFEAQAAKDIEAIHAAYPETAKYKSLRELPNVRQFARLMDDKKSGLNAVQAFSASHPDIVEAHVANAGRAKNLAGTKNHLRSSIPKGAKDTGVKLSRTEMEGFREMFSDLSDKEIRELYKKVN